MRILIAEDDQNGRRILQLFLKPYGECTLAVDGEEALNLYYAAVEQKTPYTLILLDVVMPKMQGTEVLQTIRSYERKNSLEMAKVIMLTGQADIGQINSALTLGVAEYLLKPIKEEALVRWLQRLGLVEDSQDQWK